MMWKLWNKLFGWQYIRLRESDNIHTIRMKHFGNNIWYGKYNYGDKVILRLPKWSVDLKYPSISEMAVLTDKLIDMRPENNKADNVVSFDKARRS